MKISASLWSVRTYLIWLVLASLLPAVIGAGALLAYEYRAGRAQQEEDTVQTARALVQAVDAHVLRTRAIAVALATSDALARDDFAAFHRQASEVVARSAMVTNIVVRDKAGRQLVNTAVPFGRRLVAAPAPEQVRGVFDSGQPTISDVFIGPVIKRPIMSVDVPVLAAGEVRYALGVGVLATDFDTLLKAQGLPANATAAVLDSSGTIAGRTHASERFAGRKAVPALLEAMQAAREGSLATTTKEGTPVVTSFSVSPVTKWRVAIGIPVAALTGELGRSLALLGAGVAAVFAISLFLARFASAKIAQSVQALTAPAHALGEGRALPVPPVLVKEAAEVAAAIGRASELLRAKDQELAEAHRLAHLGTWYWHLASGKVAHSVSLRDILGREVRSFADMRGSVLAADTWDRLAAAAKEATLTGDGFDLEFPLIHANGETRWAHAKSQAIRNDKGEVVALRGMLQDITDRKNAEQRLRESEEKQRLTALHDALTGLPNRAFVFEYCDHLFSAAQRKHIGGALLFIDLDRFKPINDLYGHETGDRVLQEVAKRLTACTRHEDLVGRLGGDEFVIVLPYIEGDRQRAATVAAHVVDAISRPFHINGLELSLSPSVGVSHFPDDATDVSTLLHAADLAMYQVKQSGRANFLIYSPDLGERAGETRLIEASLAKALRHGGLVLHYQPVMDIRSGKLVGAEALVRLDGSDGEAWGPDRFIPVAEATGMIVELGDWVAAEACRQHDAWLRIGLRMTIAINVSPLQFRQKTYAADLGAIVRESGVDPAMVELEVTESAVIDNLDDAVETLARIKSLGMKVALDDFGTGYSSLSSLTSLPLDKLKVDQSFVRGIENDQASRVVTDAILSLGQSLRLYVHGEGVESAAALRYLRERGCDQAQGYWFSKPLPAAQFEQWSRGKRQAQRATAS